jgi:hypothetical protein
MLENSPSFIKPSQTGTDRAFVYWPAMGLAAITGFTGKGEVETGVARYRKLGGSLEESARGAQRGLLVILATALVWLLAIWAGYHLF